MKKRLNSSILAATSLTAITIPHQVEANLVFSQGQLSALNAQNQLQSSNDVTTLDFSNMTPAIASSLKSVAIDLSTFDNVRNVVLPWFAANLNILLPGNFGTPVNDSYSRITIVKAGVEFTNDSDSTLNLETLLNSFGKVILDTKAVPLTKLIAGPGVAKLDLNASTVNLTVADTIEAIDRVAIPEGTKTSITVTPTAASTDQYKPSFAGLPASVIGTNPTSLDISAYNVSGKDVSVSGMTKLTNLIVGPGDTIGSLKVTGETNVTTNAASIAKIEFTSASPDQTVITAMAATATVVALNDKASHIASFVGKTDLDFSKLDLGSVDLTATRIKDIFTDAPVPITSIVSMKITPDVLTSVMTKLNITDLSGFSALKRLDIISATGAFQTTTLSASDLPTSLEEFYSSSLVVRKGTLSADLEFDSKFSAATLDLSGLNINGHALTIAGSFTASSVNTLKLNPSLLAVAATKNLIAANSSKSIVVSGAAGGALTTTNLQNVGTIDLLSVTGATSLNAPLNVDGSNGLLSKLYLPSAFDVEATADILSGVDNGEVTVYLSGAYSGAKTLDTSYDKTILNFSSVTGTGRFQIPSGIRGLILSDAVKGINVGAAAVLNEFDFSGLTYLRQLTDLPISATVLKLNNTSASAALQLDLTALTSLTTLHLGNSRVSQLRLPTSATLTDGGELEHLDLSNISDLAALNGLNALLVAGSITQVSFPNTPASTLHINLVDTIPGVQFNNLDKIPELTIDSDYGGGSGENMWPTVKDKSLNVDWSNFFNYIIAPVSQGGINSPGIFDLSGQAIENQTQATAFVTALNELSQANKALIQKIIIRLDAAATGTIDFSSIITTNFTHGSFEVIIDQSTGSPATVSVPAGWTAKTKTHTSLGQVDRATAESWTNYLNYRFASTDNKGQGATSLDLTSIDLTATQWTALMTALNTFSSANVIETIKLKLVAADTYSSTPEFTTATLSAATSVVVDVTGVKSSGAQVNVTGLPSATSSLQVEQRVTSVSSIDRATASSWKGYIEYLLSNISGTSYTLDLTASEVQIQSAAQLTALNSALAGLSAANQAKIQNIKLKIESGNRAADFTVSTNFTGFTNIASLVVDATGALNGSAQSTITFSLTNAPASAKAHVTSIASVDKDVSASWDYYLAYRLATSGVGLTNLDVSSVSLTGQADLTAFLTALNNQLVGDKSTVQSIKLKLDSAYVDSTVNFGVNAGSSQISGLTHGSFAVEVDRNGANSTAPVSFAFGTAITSANTTIKDPAFTSLGSFDPTNSHHWLGYARALLSTTASGTTTLDLSVNSTLELNNANVAKFIAGMNALTGSDKAKIDTLKIKLASGDFGAATADLSALNGFTALTNLVVDRNGARTSATLYAPAVSVSGSGTITVNDPELRTVSPTTQTNQWLGYLRFMLNDMSGAANTLDLSTFSIDTANTATAFNNAFQALPSAEKLKIKILKLSASFTVTLGTGVSGFTNLTNVIVDQGAAPTAAITIAAGTGATGEFADATTQKFYVTSAVTAQASGAWAKYIDYAMSSVADGGLNQTAFDLTALTLTSADVTAFLTGFTGGQAAAVTSVSLKLATAFGANSLTLPLSTGFTSLTGADAFKVYRNAAANAGTLVSVNYNGWNDSIVQIIDPTATTVADQTSAQDWLKYLSYVTTQPMFDATSGLGAQHGVLDLSNTVLTSSGEAVAFITALGLLDSSLKAKLTAIDVKLAPGNFGAGTLALSGDLRSASGFTNLTKFMVNATGTQTDVSGTQKLIDFSGLLVDGSKDMWVTSLASVDYSSTNAAASWLAYIHYQIRNDDTDFALDTSAINSGAGLTVAQAGYVFDALATLSASGTNKARLTSVNVKLATAAGAATLAINKTLSNLNGLTSIVIDATDAMYAGAQVAVDFSGGTFDGTTVTKKAIVSSLSYVDKDNQNSWTYFFNSGAMTSVDVSSIPLTSAEATAFLAALTASAGVATVTALSLKLATAFGASALDLSPYTGFSNLADSGVIIYRNGSSVDGVATSAPVTVTYGGSFTDAKVKIIDPSASVVTDTASAQQWLGYLTGVLNDAASGITLDLSSIAIDDAEAVTAFNAALVSLDSALANKIGVLKLNVTHSSNVTFGTSTTGFTGLTRIELTKPNTITVTFADSLLRRIYLTSLDSVNMAESADWSRYLNYMLSTTDGGQSASSLNLNSRTFADQTAVDAFFAGLDALNNAGIYGNKAALTTLRIKLANGVNNAEIGGSTTVATGLATGLQVIVDPNGSTDTTHAGSVANTVQADNLIVLASTAAFSKGHIAHLAEQSGFAGTLDLTGLNMQTADGATLTTALNDLSADIKAKIKTLNLKLQSGNFGSATLTLSALTTGVTEFTGVTFNINRNGAIGGANASGSLVTVTNNTGHTVNLTDAEFHDMSTFDNASSAHWIGYLTHELNSAPAGYTLDLTVNAKLMLNSANSVAAFSSGLRYLPASLKTKVAVLKVKSSTNGNFGATDLNGPGSSERVIPEYAAFDTLASVVIEYTATGLNMGAYVGHLTNTNKYAYVSTPFNGMLSADWTRFFNYQLNAANIGGLGLTTISLDKRLSSADLTPVLGGLGAAANKASLTNLTLNLASDVTLDTNVGASGLTNLATFTLNTNGSAAKITPILSFVGKTELNSINNVKADSTDSWAAYLAGQGTIAAIDVREVELANQTAVTAFLTALEAESRKATVASLKLKLASAYTGTVDFSVNAPTTPIAGLTTLNDAGVEIHRNGSAATAVQGGSITDAKIKLVDLTASSFTDRSSAVSWRSYLTALIEATPGAVDLSTDSDTYLRTNAHLTAFMSGLNTLSPANKSSVTSLKLKLAPGAAWSDITALGQGLTGFTNLTSFIVDATGVYTSAGGNPQATIAFDGNITGKTIVTELASVDKDSQDSWTYFFNTAAMTAVDISSIPLTSAEATAFLAAVGTGTTPKTSITAVTLKLNPTFGAASLAINGSGFNATATAFTVHRNGAVDSGTPVSVAISNSSATLSIIDPTISDADAVLKTSASSWLAYLTNALAGVAPITLDLTDDNLVLGTMGQATALSAALDALGSTLKAKIATLKIKAAASVTIGATLTTAGGFTALTAIELNKPAAHTITVSTTGATTQLRIADLSNVKRDSSGDWLAYVQYLMKDLGAVTNFDLDMTGTNLAEGEVQAFVTALVTISANANSSGNRSKIQKVRLKLAPGAWSGNVTDLGTNWDGFMSNINTFTVDATGATVSGTQLYVGFHADLTDQSEYTKAFVTSLNSVDKDNADAWEFYLNYLTKDGPAALDLSGTTLSYVELNALDNGLGTFSIAAGNGNKLSSIHIKVSGAAGVSNYAIAANLDAQTAIASAAEFVVDVSGFTHSGSQATVSHTGGTPKAIELRISGASDLYRNSSASWDMYLNYVKGANANTMPATVDLTGSSSLYLRTQTDVDALMTAIQAHADKASISTLNVRLAPGSVGSDITFGTGVSVINPTMAITATGATNNGSMITSADIHYAGSFTSTSKTVTQTFATTVADQTSAQNWTKYLTYLLSSTADGGLGRVAIVIPALTSSTGLTVLMSGLNSLANPLKESIQHLHLDVSHASLNGALELGTGLSGLTNLIEVTYVRASAQADATAANGSSFENKIQRLRTAWNADSIASAITVVEYLRYVLMDAAMGGLEETLVDLTSQTLDNNGDSAVYTALAPNNQNPLSSLPTELKSRITEMRIKFNTDGGGGYAGITVPNLTKVKYFQTSSAVFVAPSSSATVTTTRFRALLADVADKAAQAQWTNYIDYVMSPIADGGLGQTTFDLSSITLTSAQIGPFLAALDAHASAANVTALTLKLDPTFGAASLDVSGYTHLTGLGANTVEIRRNAAVHAAAPVTITYGGSFTDANVKIVDPETNQTADKDNTRQQWLEYLTHTIHTVGLTSGLLTVAPGDAFTSQAHVYSLFDAMEALDPSLKAQVVKLIIDISSIATGTVSLMQTGNVALTGFDNLTDVIYKRGGIDTNIDTIIASLSAALDADADAIPTWIRADEGARDSAIGNAVSDGSIRNAIANGDVNGLKSALVTQLANGITFPAADACDAAVDAAAAAVSVTVDGDVKNTLATALVPFRSTGKISGITTALTTAFTNGGTTGFGTLPWLKSSWSSYADHAAVIAGVLADSTVNSAISTDGQTTANIKTAVAAKLNSMLIPTSGQLDTLIGAINLTALSGWNSNATTFVSSLRNQLIADLYTLMPWFDTDDSADPDSIVDFISEALTNLSYYFGGTHPAAEKWDLSNSGTAIKTQITPDLKATFGAEVSPAALSAAGRLSTMIDAAFTAADSGNAVTTNTAAWVRPTAGIETDLKASIKTALEALLWYTGDSDAQSTAAVTAGGVATNNAATIISNIKTYLTDNVSRPTADSIFSAGVNTAVNSINLAVVSTAVTTDFAGVAETLSRYRVNAADVTDPENGGQWTEYLLHKLDPVALGGLGATNIDASGAPLNNDKKNNFFAAINGLPDAYRKSITSIKLTASENVGNFDGGGKPYNNNLKIILFTNQSSPPTLSVALGQEFFAEDGTTPLVSGDVIEYRITTAPAFIDNPTAIVWTHWLNHKLSSTFGGDGVTAIDLSATHAFTTQAQLNEFFAGLEALDGTNGTANKNLLQSLTLKLASGNFGAASARIGHTGSAAVTGLKSDIAINIQRNGARYGVGLESAIVTINHSDIDALSSVDGVTVDNTDAVNVDNLSSSAEWLEYLNSTLTAATGPYTLDLTDSGLELTTASSATEATALFNALQALNTTLKAKIDTIKIKLAAGAHGAGALALSGALDNAAGFTALSRIIVDVTDAETDVSGMQKIINFSGVTVEAGVAKEARITALASVDLVSANATDSWLAYLNYITRTGTAALDTSAVNSGNGLTVAELNSVFDALANFSTANDNPSRLTAVTAKMAAAGGSGTFAVNQDLSNLSGLTSIIIDATDAMDSGAQVSVNFGGIFHASTVTKEARITALASVDLDNSDSWGYYLNYLKATNSNLESIDLSTRDLADTDSGTTQPNVDAFFTALEARADRTTVKDIHLNISGVDTLTLTVGTGSSTLTALTSVVIKRHAGATSTFTAAGDVAATDLAVINSAMGTLGASGTVAQWKGYFAYLLEDAAHGGAYTGSNPIAINLTATALQVNSLAVLQHIETVIAELPARLKARISAILIKTTDTSVDYTAAAAYEFGDAFTAPILAELSALKAVIIESCTDDADPVFDTDGDFFNTPSISKIVYHTTINII